MIKKDPNAAARIQQHWEIAKTLNPNISSLLFKAVKITIFNTPKAMSILKQL